MTQFQFLAVFGDVTGQVGGAPLELHCPDEVVGGLVGDDEDAGSGGRVG